MNTHFVLNAFIRWLSINKHRFNNPPCNIIQVKDKISFNLSGIIKTLQWSITENYAELTVHQLADFSSHDESMVDIVNFYDVEVTKQLLTGQYFCHLCEEQYRQYYPTELALWEGHCFEEVLSWSNHQLTNDKLLILSGDPNFYSARLLSAIEWQLESKIQTDDIIQVIPVQVNANNSQLKG